MDLQSEYKNMDVSHLTIEEVEHELLIRNLLFRRTDHESVKRRKLKDRMKEERALGYVSTAFARTWRTATEEMALMNSSLTVITGLLEHPKVDSRQIVKLRTRMVHYRVRIAHLSIALDARKYSSQVRAIEKQIDSILDKYFPTPLLALTETSEEIEQSEIGINEALQEVRNEIEELNETVAILDDENIPSQGAVGGTKIKSIESRKNEMESSMRRADEILDKLTEFEQGKIENIGHLIRSFKDFVIQTSDKERARREQEIEIEKGKKIEAEANIERKKKLESLLIDLNDKIKQNSGLLPNDQTPSASIKASSNNEHAPPSDLSDSERIQRKSNEKNKKKSKSVKSEDTSTTDVSESDLRNTTETDESSSTESSVVEQRKKSKKSKKGKSRKHKRTVKFSSDNSDGSSESESMSSSESSCSSSDDSSDSADDRRRKYKNRKRKHRKGKRNKEALKRIPISEWKLKYEGKDNGRKLGEFLKEIKMRCRSEKVTDRELFRSALYLFSGRAKDWYMEGVENKDFRNWRELKKELKREFLPPDLDFQLEIQATNRRHTRGEKFVDYFHDMQKIFHSMTKSLSDRRKFRIIWRNMRTDYKNALMGTNIKSLNKLKKFGRLVDENNFNNFQKTSESTIQHRANQVGEITSGNQKPKNQSDNTKIYKNNNKEQGNNKTIGKDTREQKENFSKRNNIPTENKSEPLEGSSKGTLAVLVEQYCRPPIGTCYNCRKPGHHYVECPEDRRKFCRLCGFSDVYTSACPFCRKNLETSA